MFKSSNAHQPMDLADGLPDQAEQLYKELARLVQSHSARADSFYYNGFTAMSLLATGAAAVVATSHPLVASALSAAAAFLIAISRALNFGGRWRWHLQRQADYSKLIYLLNEAALLDDERAQREAVRKVYDRLILQSASDASIPGSGEPVASDGNLVATRAKNR